VIETQRISARQIFFVIWAATYGGGVYYACLIISKAGRDIFFSYITGGIILILMGLAVWHLSKSFPGYTIIQILEQHAGGITGTIFAVIYIFISIALVALLIRLVTGLVGAFFLINTPGWFPILMILLLALYIAAKGIEVQTRLFVMVMPVLVSLWFITTSIGFINNQFDFSNLLPIFESSPAQLISGGYLFIAPVCESILALLLFTASLRNPSQSRGSIIMALAMGAVIISMATDFITIGMLGVELASRVSYHGLNITLIVSVGEFIQGIEVLLLVALEVGAIIKATIHIYCAWMTASHLLNDRFRRAILAAIGIIAYIATISIDSFNRAFFYYRILSEYVVFPFVALTLILTLILVAAGNKKRNYLG
jgi:spore germination protein (amino acid permease)